MTLTVSGADRSIKFDWAAASRAWAASVEPAATAIMKARAPFRTGALRQGISSRIESEPGSTQVVIYGTASYLPYVLGGTQPHVITARNARALRWTGRGGIGVSFARSVNHPGTKPDDFPEQAMAIVTPAILSRFAEAVKEAVIVE
jgi:hypothetical protein